MSFAFKIDKALKANLYKICRLCGIDREEKITILDSERPKDNQPVDCDDELKLHQKIIQCIGITVVKDDKMPQSACSLCVDKINDFYEFREMCYATDIQTRKLLGLKREIQKKNTTNVKPIVDVKPVIDIKEEVGPKRGRKRKADDTPAPVAPKIAGPKGVIPKGLVQKGIVPKGIVPKGIIPKGIVPKGIVPKGLLPKGLIPRVVVPKVVIPKEDPTPEVKSEQLPQPSSNKKQRLSEPAPVETKKKAKLGKQVDKAVKPKEEIKEEPALKVEVEKSSTAPTEKTSATKFRQVCSICTQRFGSKLKLEQHVAATHVPHIPRYVCTACNEIIKKTNDIKSHQLWHKLTKTPYMCGHCGQSLISSYAYSRHLRDHTVDIPPNLWVLDRECPQCHQTFLTNFLYNTHICAVKTKKCAGCNRQLRNEVEYQRHAAHCNKVYLNYSKHIPAAAAAAESSIRIKNENDVEAAAAEALARNSGIPLDMAPVVSLTRISTPEIMAASRGIKDFNNESPIVQIDEPKTPGKKGSKKGVSRKDLKRVDNLLKSTLDALVSIKHEPEVHVGADADTAPASAPHVPSESESSAPAPSTELSTEEIVNKEKEEQTAADDHNFTAADDFHHGDDDSNDAADNKSANVVADATTSTNTNDIAIKQEPVEETLAHGAINVKQEVIDVDSDSSVPAAKMPVLKLKIKKEHGMLNSSIVDEPSARAEKKKKKKKRKDAARNKEKSDGDEQQHESTAVQDEEMEVAEDTLPNSNIVVAIKQEKLDENDDATESHRGGSSEPSLQLEPTVMTTIPIPQFQPILPQFQISAVSSGVEFDTNITETDADEEQDDMETRDAAATPDLTNDEIELEDIKPNKAELDRLFQITNISSGVQMDYEKEVAEEETANIIPPQATPQQELNATVSSIGVNAQKKITKSTTKVVTHKALEHKTSPTTQKRAAKAFKSTAGVNKTNADRIRVCETQFNLSQIQIKPEPVDRGYEAVFNAYEAAINPSVSEQTLNTDEDLSPNEIAEQEYLKNIDFANIQIKQEKDLDVSDVEITNTHIVANAIPNGMKRANGEESQYSENYEDMSSIDNEETDVDDYEDDEDDDDEYWDGVKIAEDEKREYRELEMPPLLLTEETNASENTNVDYDMQEKKNMSIEDKELECRTDFTNCENPSTTNAVAALPEEERTSVAVESLQAQYQLTANNVNVSGTIKENIAENIVVNTGKNIGEEMANNNVENTADNIDSNTAENTTLLQLSIQENNASALKNEQPTTSTVLIADILKISEPDSAPLPTQPPPLPFIISSIYSQADNVMTDQLPEIMDTDDNMVQSQYIDRPVTDHPDTPMMVPTLKISSVLAGCSASFDDLSNLQLQPQQMSTTLSPDNLTTALLAEEAMEIGRDAVNIGVTMNEPTDLLADGAVTLKNITDISMDTTPATQTMCMQMNVDKDALLEAQPFTEHGDGVIPMTATTTAVTPTITTDTSHITQSNENVAIGISILNVVGGAIEAMSEDMVEEAQNLLNHEVVEAQATQQQQQLTIDNSITSQFVEHTQQEMTQNVEETENLMNESVVEALLLQQQQQQLQQHHTDLQIASISSVGDISILLPFNSRDADKNSNSGNNIDSANPSTVGLRPSQSTMMNNPYLLDDSNINEIAENNNNANIERELQDDVAAAATAAPIAITPTVQSNIDIDAVEQNNADLMDTKTNDIT
ncbi:uncharacterized protein [Eurosta solidaginis]|uniref:uncharacterized protein n=1 Tax=Eurosta solidaginis TaxID=178769 RepID=UPI003530F3B3